MRDLARRGRIELSQTVTRASETAWEGRRGRIDRGQLAAMIRDPATLCFICGPDSLVDEVPGWLRELGIAPGRIRVEEWHS
jgi:ferredoxin-NADP reductase